MTRQEYKGFLYVPGVLSAEEQQVAVDFLKTVELEHQQYGDNARARGYKGPGQVLVRGYRQFGVAYHITGAPRDDAPPIPDVLRNLLVSAAPKVVPSYWPFNQCVFMHYPKGTGVNWHTDGKRFGEIIVGISLGVPATMQLRRTGTEEAEFAVELEPGSAYVLAGTSRNHCQHMVKTVDGDRYSLTYRLADPNAPV
ncbi:MAG: hypothetical protein EP335_09530 [Alphaproteobacteria bacterium]|nr:MAG: hypothetical protein EP335_09530 [Alphaproteobacteria bacterium]